MTNEKNKPIDLSSMDNFEIEPSWVKKSESKNTYQATSGKDRYPSNDRKGERRPKTQNRGNQKQFRIQNREDHVSFEFKILPEKEILDRIKREMRKTGVSYALSDICKTISEKKERFTIKIRFEGDKPKYFTKTIVDQKVFSTTEKAINHLLVNYFDSSFLKEIDIEDKLVKGFNYIYRCPKTKSYLPPNSYHRFEEITKQHMWLNSINEKYDKFLGKLEKVEDPEEINLWTETPLKIYKFAIKEENPSWCKGIEQLRKKLISEIPESLIEKTDMVRISAASLHLLETNISEQFKAYFKFKTNWSGELFTSCLVNLKKSNFSIFKYSDKKITFACAYKPNKNKQANISSSAQKILSFLLKTNETKKGMLLKTNELDCLTSKDILLELKWMVKEGYISEFSNGVITVN